MSISHDPRAAAWMSELFVRCPAHNGGLDYPSNFLHNIVYAGSKYSCGNATIIGTRAD